MNPATQSFSARDGVKIAYAVTGDPQSRKRALLIHSLAMDGAYWLGPLLRAFQGVDQAAWVIYMLHGYWHVGNARNYKRGSPHLMSSDTINLSVLA